MRTVLKVHRKGVVVLPKRLREVIGIDEGDEVVVEVVGDTLVMRALKPRVVDIDPEIVEKLLQEEYYVERGRYEEMIQRGEDSSRH